MEAAGSDRRVIAVCAAQRAGLYRGKPGATLNAGGTGGQAALSEYHFARMFRQSMGTAPHQYVMQRRMEKAKAMVQHTTTPLTDIALACGFNSASHFSNRFRSMTGITPSQLRAAKA